ncbi:hypothetical protein D3C71_2038350 [compost metagenome]
MRMRMGVRVRVAGMSGMPGMPVPMVVFMVMMIMRVMVMWIMLSMTVLNRVRILIHIRNPFLKKTYERLLIC